MIEKILERLEEQKRYHEKGLANTIRYQECVRKNEHHFRVSMHNLGKDNETQDLFIIGDVGESIKDVVSRAKQKFIETYKVSIYEASIFISVFYNGKYIEQIITIEDYDEIQNE